MKNITQQSKKQTFLNTIKIKNGLTVEENILQDAKITSSLQKIIDDDFLQEQYIYMTDFVEIDHFNNNLFYNSSLDIKSIESALIASNDLLENNKDTLNSQFNELQLKTNILNSAIDASAINNSMSLGNIGSIVETFATTNDIIVQQNPLLIDVFQKQVTLPIKDITSVNLSNADIVILDGSNGYVYNGSINNIYDNNIETLLDYRQTNSVDKLILNVGIVINEAQIFNQLTINVNNFSTQNWVKIKDILYSLDGNQFNSVFENKQLYQQYLFNDINDKVIVLNPEKNHMLDKFVIDFAPIKAKYIQILLEQDKLDPIDHEYKIGFKEFGLHKVIYENTGNIIVKKPFSLENIEAIGIKTDMFSNLNTKILNISFAISFDMNTWYDIQPFESDGIKPEILYINTPWMNDNITVISSEYIYVKICFDKTVTDIQTLIKQITSEFEIVNYEYFNFPTIFPYSFKLKHLPVENSLKLYSVPFIGIGKDEYNKIVLGKTQTNKNIYIYDFLVNMQNIGHIKIDNIEINRYNTKEELLHGDFLGYVVDNKKIYINIPNNTNTITDFIDPWLNDVNEEDNNSTTTITISNLLNNRDIILIMNADLLRSTTRKIPLTYLTDGIKDNIKIYRMGLENGQPIVKNIKDIIPSKITKIHLSNTPILTRETTIRGAYRVNYIDGFTEFRGQEFAYSIDVINKMLYLSNAYTKTDITIDYYYYDILELTENDFSLVREDDVDYILLNQWMFDPELYYKIEYNAVLLIPNDIYTVEQDTVTFSDSEIVKILVGNSNYTEKNIKTIYSYNENLQVSILEFIDTLTPILGNLSILYSVKL